MVLAAFVAFAAFLWIVAVASALVSFALTAAIAVAWCIRLEKHPETIEVFRG